MFSCSFDNTVMCLHLYMIEFEVCINSLSTTLAYSKTQTLRSAFLPLLHGSFTFSNLSHVLWRPCHGCRHWRAGAPLWWFGGARWAQLGRGAWQFVRRPSCIQNVFTKLCAETKITGRLFLLMIWWGEFGAPVGWCNSEVVWEGAIINQAP